MSTTRKFVRPFTQLATAAVLAIGLPTAASAGQADINWSISIGSHSGPVYVAPPPVVYVPAQPVYVAPRPVYVQPHPIYVQPGTVVHIGSPHYVYESRHRKNRHPHWKHRREHREYREHRGYRY